MRTGRSACFSLERSLTPRTDFRLEVILRAAHRASPGFQAVIWWFSFYPIFSIIKIPLTALGTQHPASSLLIKQSQLFQGFSKLLPVQFAPDKFLVETFKIAFYYLKSFIYHVSLVTFKFIPSNPGLASGRLAIIHDYFLCRLLYLSESKSN